MGKLFGGSSWMLVEASCRLCGDAQLGEGGGRVVFSLLPKCMTRLNVDCNCEWPKLLGATLMPPVWTAVGRISASFAHDLRVRWDVGMQRWEGLSSGRLFWKVTRRLKSYWARLKPFSGPPSFPQRRPAGGTCPLQMHSVLFSVQSVFVRSF